MIFNPLGGGSVVEAWQFTAAQPGALILVLNNGSPQNYIYNGADWVFPTNTSSWYLQPVLSKLGAPPGTPSEGDRYLIAAGTGAWSGRDGQIAAWVLTYGVGAWQYSQPPSGSMVVILNNGNPETEIFT